MNAASPKLGVSNLAWPAEAEDRAFGLLAEKGALGLEVAPTKIAPWNELTSERLKRFRRKTDAAGLVTSSLQAVFFGCPDATLLGDEAQFEAMCDHTRHLALIAEVLGASVAVFGAPKSRLRGALSQPDAMRRAAERLRVLGDIAMGGGLSFGIEPVPPIYGADFLNHASDMLELVALTDHPNILPHLDTACVALAGDDPVAAIRRAMPNLAHYHMAEPNLGPFKTPELDHDAAGRALHETGYRGWLVIEMKHGDGDGLEAVATAIDYARLHYIRC